MKEERVNIYCPVQELNHGDCFPLIICLKLQGNKRVFNDGYLLQREPTLRHFKEEIKYGVDIKFMLHNCSQ